MLAKHLKSDSEWMSKTKELLQGKHTHCIEIDIKKQTSFYMQAMLKQTSKIQMKMQ